MNIKRCFYSIGVACVVGLLTAFLLVNQCTSSQTARIATIVGCIAGSLINFCADLANDEDRAHAIVSANSIALLAVMLFYSI